MDDSTPWGWILGAIATVGSVLSAAVANLYRTQVKIYEARITQLEGDVVKLSESSQKCKDEHTLTKVELATLNERLRQLENCA